MFAEPGPTGADLHFRMFGVPVRVHPMFWIVTAIMGSRSGDVKFLLLWVVAVFVSIMVHEFGHVLAYAYYGMPGRVVLHAFGGLAISDGLGSPWQTGYRTRHAGGGQQIVISLAGPVAGFLLAGCIVAILFATQTQAPIDIFTIPLGPTSGQHLADFDPYWYYFVVQMLFVNVFWGLVNLLPIYPLDGGQISRELFLMANVREGIRTSLILSIVTAAGIAAWILFRSGQEYMITALFFAYLAYNSFMYLQAYTGGGGWGSGRW
jgi:Zn-dependent protease